MAKGSKGKFACAALVLVFALVAAGCTGIAAQGEAASTQAQQPRASIESTEAGGGKGMTEEEQAVLESYEAMQQAMVDKDVEAMRALTTEDKTFTHMSGKVQMREEFFGEIADGTLNYFGYQIHDPHVTVDGDHATLTGSTTLDARVYCASGSWTLPTNARFVKVDGKWVQCD